MAVEKTAIIIGAGIGGITTSIYLAREGYKVTVYERNAAPGGRCGQIIREGHRFDLGATIYLMPEVYRKTFESLNLIPEESFKAVPLTTLYKIYFGDGKELAFTTDKAKFREQLESIEKGSYQKSEELVKNGYTLFNLAIDKLLGKNFYHLFEFITLKNALLLLRLKTYMRHTSYIKRFFKDPHLQKAFTFQNIYVGQNPYQAPALFSMLPAAELTEGSLFPVGGMYAITQKLVSVATEAGVNFVYNEPVVKILTEGNRATAVVLPNGSMVRANIIVANADLPYVYRELLTDSLARRINKMKYSCSSIVFHWGLSKAYPQLSHHSVFLSPSYRQNLKTIFKDHSISNDPSFYVHSPVRSDESAAPAGQDSISIIIPAGHLLDNDKQNWVELKTAVRKAVIAQLVKHGLTDIEEHIKFEICYLPQTWKNLLNLTRGATFGSLGHNIFQMGYFRPHNRHRKYKNLYFTGGSTHPGNGIPLVLLSAKLACERIFKEHQS